MLWLITGQVTRTLRVDKGVWSTVRKFSTTLDSTVIRDFEEELNLQGIYTLVKHNKTKKSEENKNKT